MADPRSRPREFEWPTLALIVACHALWVVSTVWLAALWLPAGMAGLTLAVTLHSSLQHEVLHGHPFRSRALNEALVFLPVGLFYPYGRFRDLHLAHHRDETLTDPYDDPESNFLDPRVWAALPGWRRRLLRANNTLLGRMALGPALGIVKILMDDGQAILAGNRAIARDWALHLAGLVLVGLWIAWSGVPVWAYLVSAYLGMSVLKIRTYLEHRAHEDAPGRTVVVEDRGLLAFLFLNNNLHIVHHTKPGVPWYRLPAVYAAGREEFLRRNEGYLYPSYGAIFRRHLLRAKDPVPHPLRPGN
ncbi:MAG: fatty acid desaturase [Rhodobacteraceae bacterium]|nr:fatty acid desaturase [Paracoccaceae bacterium]